MNQEFSKTWVGSKQPRKQRKYLANAPIHIKRKQFSVNLSKELRAKYGKRNIELRKGDVVKIMIGRFKKQSGKVLDVKTKLNKIYIEGIQIKKMDGSKVNFPIKSSNLQIINLDMADKKRVLSIERKKNDKKKEMGVKEK